MARAERDTGQSEASPQNERRSFDPRTFEEPPPDLEMPDPAMPDPAEEPAALQWLQDNPQAAMQDNPQSPTALMLTTSKFRPPPPPTTLVTPPQPPLPPPAGPPPQHSRCLCPDDMLPPGYGAWDDRNNSLNIATEDVLARDHNLYLIHRGPNPYHREAPTLWKGIPFNEKKKIRACWMRSQLPGEYKRITDWFSEDGLAKEAEIARYYQIPWSLRGPPTGPIDGKPKLWRGMQWRPRSEKWMKRAGENLSEQNSKYSKR